MYLCQVDSSKHTGMQHLFNMVEDRHAGWQVHGQALTKFSNKLSELRNTLLAAPEMVPAMSRAASIFLSVMKAGFCWMASPIRRAEVASPCALMMALCLSCSALSTCSPQISQEPENAVFAFGVTDNLNMIWSCMEAPYPRGPAVKSA